jgi:hypothetical protein
MSASLQRYGVFLNIKNPADDAQAALRQAVQMAMAAETQGYHDVWVAEHHYSAYAIGSAQIVLLAHQLVGIATSGPLIDRGESFSIATDAGGNL